MLDPAYAQAPDPITRTEITAHILQPQAVAPTDARLEAVEVPAGFTLHRFAEGLDSPRIMRATADGTVYVSQRKPGSLVMLRDTNRDGVADVQKTVLDDLPLLHGIEIRGERIYLTAVHHLWSAAIHPDGSIGELRTLLDDLPDAGQHPNRTLRFGPDGALYLSVGSTAWTTTSTGSATRSARKSSTRSSRTAATAGRSSTSTVRSSSSCRIASRTS